MYTRVLPWLLLMTCTVLGEQISVSEMVVAARCQSHCLTKYLSGSENPISDSACRVHTGCFACWMSCERLALKPRTPTPQICHTTQCTDGCRTACSFMKTAPVAMAAMDSKSWWFPDTPLVRVVSEDMLVVSWERVVQKHDMPGVVPVYILLWGYHARPAWELVSLTTEREVEIQGPYQQYRDFRLLLLVVTEQGVVAEALPDLPRDGPFRTLDLDMGRSTGVSVGVEVVLVEGEIQAEVTWLSPDSGDLGDDLSGDLDAEVKVEWGRDSCQAHPSLPPCPLNNPVFYTNDTIDLQLVSFVLTALTYNSEYWVTLTFPSGAVTRKPFLTPWCNNPSGDLRACHDLPRVFTPKDSVDKHGYTQEQAVPIYVIVVTCLVAGILLFAVVLVVVRRQKQMRRHFRATAAFLRERAGSLRSSLRSGRRAGRWAGRSPARWSSPSSSTRSSPSTKSGYSGSTDLSSSSRLSGLAQRLLSRGSSTRSARRNPYMDALPVPPVPPRYTFTNTSPSHSPSPHQPDLQDSLPHLIKSRGPARDPQPDDVTFTFDAEVYFDIDDVIEEVAEVMNDVSAVDDVTLTCEDDCGWDSSDITDALERITSSMTSQRSRSLPRLDDLEMLGGPDKFKLYHTLSVPLDWDD